MKKKVKDCLETLLCEGDQLEMLSFLEDTNKLYYANYDVYSKMFIELERHDEPYSDYHSYYLKVYGERDETDAEYQIRLESERSRDLVQDERNRKEFERLKKLLGV